MQNSASYESLLPITTNLNQEARNTVIVSRVTACTLLRKIRMFRP